MDNYIDNNSGDDHYFNDLEFDMAHALPPLSEEYLCQAISFNSKASIFEGKNGDKKNVIFCKICQFEGRGNIHKGTVFCSNHGLSLS